MTAELLAAIAGAVVSFAFSYVPGLAGWFEGQDSTVKRLLMGGVLIVVAAAIFGLACYGIGPDIGIDVECSQAGALGLIQVLIYALMANQAAFLISPK